MSYWQHFHELLPYNIHNISISSLFSFRLCRNSPFARLHLTCAIATGGFQNGLGRGVQLRYSRCHYSHIKSLQPKEFKHQEEQTLCVITSFPMYKECGLISSSSFQRRWERVRWCETLFAQLTWIKSDCVRQIGNDKCAPGCAWKWKIGDSSEAAKTAEIFITRQLINSIMHGNSIEHVESGWHRRRWWLLCTESE